jgi:thiamine biosynthesis lipoprotein
MGTTYRVTYVVSPGVTPPGGRAVEDLLQAINQSVSTYIPSSAISQINSSRDAEAWHPIDDHFAVLFRRSRSIYEDTHGAFNPAVGPLVDAWGFGSKPLDVLPDDSTIRKLLPTVSFDAFDLRDSPLAVRKRIPEAQLDFGGIAKGYAVDAIAYLLDEAHVQDYLVEIAGEVRARGRHPDGKVWRVGIEKPSENALAAQHVQTIIELENRALSTSGDYRNYKVEDGKTLGHILDPRTGYPASNSLLSATVVARDAMTSDAYATALIVMGLDDAMKFVEDHSELSAYFISKDDNGGIVEKRSSRFPQSE